MKKTLEAVLVVAALGLGILLLRQWRERRELAERPPVENAGGVPGTDVEKAGQVPPSRGAPGSVVRLPMVKLSSPPKTPRRSGSVPPPASGTP